MIRVILICLLSLLVACSAYKKLPIENKSLVITESYWRYVSNKGTGNVMKKTGGVCPSYFIPSIVVSKYKQRKNTIIVNGSVGYNYVLYDSMEKPIENMSHVNFNYIIYSCNIENNSITNQKEVLKNKKQFRLVLHNDSSKYLILYNCRDSIGFVYNEQEAIKWMFYDRNIE